MMEQEFEFRLSIDDLDEIFDQAIIRITETDPAGDAGPDIKAEIVNRDQLIEAILDLVIGSLEEALGHENISDES